MPGWQPAFGALGGLCGWKALCLKKLPVESLMKLAMCVEEVGGRVRRQKWAFPTHHSVEVARGVSFSIL